MDLFLVEYLIAGLIGAVCSLFIQSIIYPRFSKWILQRRNAERLALINKRFDSFGEIFQNLKLQQAGWAQDGAFEPSTIRIELTENNYILPDQIRINILDRYEEEWGNTASDDKKIGVSSLMISRIIDNPEVEEKGLAQKIIITTHTYNYYSFLATHRRLAYKEPADMRILEPYLSKLVKFSPIHGFPNPLSVGLTLLCESGNILVLPIRTNKLESGGDWHGGKTFNAVGEQANISDFRNELGGKKISDPYVIARRGLHEEMGFSQKDIDNCEIRIHSLAWASDICDHKFFGYAVTKLAENEVRNRWENSPDRHENSELHFFSVETRSMATVFWLKVLPVSESWAPEALFCTARTLALYGKLLPEDLLPKV